MKILETKEQKFLKIISKTLSNSDFLGDDCAILKKFNLAMTMDTLIQDVHFDLKLTSPFNLGKKAVLVNLSDILASGAKPYGVLISLSGNLSVDFVKEFYLGVNEICNRHNISVLGGDLTKADKIIISIAAIGDIKNRKISSRKNAKNGYVVAVSGFFGSSEAGRLNCPQLLEKHLVPVLQFKTANAIATKAQKPYAMMDSSDGLLDCLSQISHFSNVGIKIDYDKIPRETEDKNLVLFGGEDYSLVCCLHASDFKNVKGLTKIGIVTDEMGVFVDGTDYSNKKMKGFLHFD